MTSWITICDTGKSDGWDADAGTYAKGKTGGQMRAGLMGILVAEITDTGSVKLQTSRHSCLMRCKRNCSITLQSAGKIGYFLDGPAPDKETGEVIVAYAFHYAKSTSGQVPYRDWPQGIKGHFVSRHPPLPDSA